MSDDDEIEKRRAFYAAVLNIDHANGTTGSRTAEGMAYSMAENAVSIANHLFQESGNPVRVALELEKSKVKKLVIFDQSLLTTRTVPMKLTGTVARLGKLEVFLNDARSAGMLFGAIIREVRVEANK